MFGILTVYLVAIVVLLYAYVYVWSRGPQDGRLWRMIRRLRKGTRYWRKRALRDEAILSRVIDKKTLVLGVFLCLFLISVANPSPYIDSCTIVDGPFTPLFSTAADGDESSESITSFSETSADDVGMLYPDSTNDLDKYVNTSRTYQDDCADDTRWSVSNFEAFDHFADDGSQIYCNYTTGGVRMAEKQNPDPDVTVANEATFLITKFKWTTNHSTGRIAISMLDLGGSGCGGINSLGYSQGVWLTLNDTIEWDGDADDGVSSLSIMLYALATDDVYIEAWIEYIAVTDTTLYDTVTSGYTEPFSSVSDWTVQSGATMTTDGDVLSLEIGGSGWTWQGGVYTNDVSFSAGDWITTEIRIDRNASTENLRVYVLGHSQNDTAGTQFDLGVIHGVYIPDGWATYKGSMTLAYDLESVQFMFRVNDDYTFYCDYIRISTDTTEFGWQHDGSTTAGTSNDAEAGITYTSSSDGDKLTLNMTWTSLDRWCRWRIAYDTTATVSDIDRDYYPFYELQFICTTTGSVPSTQAGVDVYYDGYETLHSDFAMDGSDVTIRGNMEAETTTDTKKYIDFYAYLNGAGESIEYVVDWVKIYNIANYTYTGSGVGIDDYLYVDSGILYSNIDDGYIELNHDPALSVSDTYSVYNLTTSGTAPEFSQYVSSWSSYSDDTRGATTSGTVTDIKLKFYSTETLSTIKFIEDGTAPSILRISATPPEPDDTESVTLSALATDTVEVYKVWFRPITGPTGYSPTDYESTEQADNLWTYEFSSLDEGYWAFKAIAFDGANNSTLDADSVTDFWVREKELIISNTLYTETSTQCSFAGQTNVACDYLIYDDDVEQESGNKAAGSFFLDWTKQTSVGTHDWGIKFYTASSTDWHNGSYEVLTTTLLVTEYGIRTTDNYAYLNGYVTLDSNYTVYEETVEVGTGSVSAGSFEIRWTKASSSVENVTVLFESGSQSYPVYSGYDVAEQATFVVESCWMDLNLGVESYVEFYVLSSFENATVYVYDNDTLMTTVTEAAGGAYSYFWLSESEGLHIITLNITHGGTTHTRTRTYYIPDWAATGLVMRWDLWTFQDNYTMMELESNWMNCTFEIYLNSSLVATSYNDPVTLNFTRSINVGTYNLTIFADGGTQTYKILNIRYIITEEGVSYDYSSVTGGRSVAYGDNYYDYYTITGEPTPGILIDQGTATIVSVGGFLIFFLAFLAAREIKKSEILKTERVLSR